jgi:hypothetical protein
MELISAPKLDRSQPEWKAVRSRNQTGVHQHSAGYVVAGLAAMGVRRGQLLEDADRLRSVPVVRELGRVVKHQHRRVLHGGEALPRTEKMPSQDLLLINPSIRKETISCLRSRPLLTGEGDASTDLS